jgi:hypothetical protein
MLTVVVVSASGKPVLSRDHETDKNQKMLPNHVMNGSTKAPHQGHPMISCAYQKKSITNMKKMTALQVLVRSYSAWRITHFTFAGGSKFCQRRFLSCLVSV